MDRNSEREFFANIKAGDKVAILNYHWTARYTPKVVERVTKTLVKLEGSDQMYRKSDGGPVGRKYVSEKLAPWDDRAQHSIDLQAARNDAQPYLDWFALCGNRHNLEDTREITEFIKKLKNRGSAR